MLKTIKKQWFMLGLVLVFAVVILDGTHLLSKAGIFLKRQHGPEILIFFIFFISGLLISSEQIKAGIKDFKSTLLALFVIIVFAPIAALLFSILPMDTGMLIGLFIVAAMPTTLSSGVVMTGTAGGNMAHALFITVLSNFIAIFSIPVVLTLLLSFLSQEKVLDINQTGIIYKLAFLVLLPLAIGIVAKSRIPFFKTLKKFNLQMMNQCAILLVVFISLSGAKQVLMEGEGIVFLYILLLVAGFHLLLISCSFVLVKLFNIKKGRSESVIFMGSQKTLPLAVMIQISYFSEFGTALVVCVMHHIVHLMIDGYLSAKKESRLFN